MNNSMAEMARNFRFIWWGPAAESAVDV